MTVVILCGGAGTRLWPLSRPENPKQFASLREGSTLFESTVARNLPIAGRFIVITNAAHRDMAIRQFRRVAGPGTEAIFILEPMGRNTAPAIALAAISAPEGEVLLVTPADHSILDEEAYRAAATLAGEVAPGGELVTFGVRPTTPETGYGYIETGEPSRVAGLFKVRSFREKPSRATAEGFLKAGTFTWNSGMFVFSKESIIEEMAAYALSILEASGRALDMSVQGMAGSEHVITIDAIAMEAIPATSIDYAVMEKSRRLLVLPVSMGWDDLGSYDTLWNMREKDSDGNSSSGNVIFVNSTGNLVIANGARVALAGVDDLVVIRDGDNILVVRRGKTQLVNEVVRRLALTDEASKPEHEMRT